VVPDIEDSAAAMRRKLICELGLVAALASAKLKGRATFASSRAMVGLA
jgi:hypothetical protein